MTTPINVIKELHTSMAHMPACLNFVIYYTYIPPVLVPQYLNLLSEQSNLNWMITQFETDKWSPFFFPWYSPKYGVKLISIRLSFIRAGKILTCLILFLCLA